MRPLLRVFLIGGTGVFGSRLARLLGRDDCQVIVASRRLPEAQQIADEIGGEAIAFDREKDLSAIIAARADVVVDAAGPFQSYGERPYRVVEFCIANRLHYFDLSDDAAFTLGVTQFDEKAKLAGVVIVSGASSVPAISAAVVADLSKNMRQIDTIDTAILPGNRAPRGASVIASILSQVGGPLRLWRDSAWTSERAWSEPVCYQLAPGVRRTARLIGAPDLILFPNRFRARSVTFHAGMELRILNAALSVYGGLRRLGVVRPWRWFISFAQAVAAATESFGSDRGGMIVRVTGDESGRFVERSWTLLAESGEGPFIPATPVRAYVKLLNQLPSGARPAIGDLNIDNVSSAMSDLAVSSTTNQRQLPTLFEKVLGSAFDVLPAQVRELHSAWREEVFEGRASVERGTHPIARFVATLLRFPKAGGEVPASVTIRPTPRGETWTRCFAQRRFRSYLSQRLGAPSGMITERFGPMSFDLPLDAEGDVLKFPVARGRVLGIPMPQFLLPISTASEFVRDGRFHFDVRLDAPLGIGQIVRYRGFLEPVKES